MILHNITKHISLTPSESAYFLSLLEEKSLKSRQLHLREGAVCDASTFVVRGCLKGFTTDRNGFAHTLSFAPSGWWIADMYSLVSREPSVLTIQALEPSEVLLLSRSNQEMLYREIPAFERFFRILAENSLVAHQQRIIDNLSLSAEARFEAFCKRYPTLVAGLPQKEIASYIGVTPEFFSKMRSQLLRKK